MLSSKANAALMRVKEMEEKYKTKRREQIWNRKEDMDSSISSVSINFSENLSAKLKESPKIVSKLKLNIKMPDIRFEEHVDETKLSSQDKKSTSDGVSPKSEDADEVDLDVEMPLEDKSSHSAEKQESSISEVTTIQEDSLIESMLDDSMTTSKSSSKVSRQNFSTTATNKLSGRKERIKVDGKLKKGKESDKSSEISRNKPLNNSLIAKSSKLSERSKEKSSKGNESMRQHMIEEEKIIKTSKLMNSDRNLKNLNHSELLHDDSIINKSIDTIENDSEIVSELSHAEESLVTNTEDVNFSINLQHLVSENAHVMVSNSSKHSIAENEYTNDTFEDVSSLTMRSKSELQRKKIIDAENMLIKLHGDVTNTMAKRETRSEIAKSSSRIKTELEDQNAAMRKVKKKDENYRPSGNDKISDHNSHEYNTKQKKRRTINTSAKSAKTCNSIGSCKEDKALRLDEKQMRRLQKRIVELRLQQEREDLQKYLHELKDLRLQSSATPSYFSPLEFPKIAKFTQPDAIEIESKPDDQYVVLRERVLAIRRWLKDQYVLYRDYCTMAQAINAHYVPTTLDDAKKTLR